MELPDGFVIAVVDVTAKAMRGISIEGALLFNVLVDKDRYTVRDDELEEEEEDAVEAAAAAVAFKKTFGERYDDCGDRV